MTSLLTAWLADYYVLATLLLALEALAATLIRRPARRLALARATLLGLAVSAVLLALPGRAHWGLDVLAAPATTWSPVVAGLYASGVMLVSAWLLLGAIRAWRLRQRSQPAPAEVQRLLERDAPAVAVRLDEHLTQPVALGAWQPVVLLPCAMVHETPTVQLEAVLAHEQAHVRNGDLRWAALGRLLLLALFAHPLYWLLRRRLRVDQEMQADAAAAGHDGAINYAETLLDFARQATSPKRSQVGSEDCAHPTGGRGLLQRRIAALLHPDFTAHDRWAGHCHAIAAVAIVLAVLVASPLTLRQVQRPMLDVAVMPNVEPVAAVPTPAAPLVKVEIVVRLPAPAPLDPVAQISHPAMPRVAVSKVDLVFWTFDSVYQQKNEWLTRILKWWFLQRLRGR